MNMLFLIIVFYYFIASILCSFFFESGDVYFILVFFYYVLVYFVFFYALQYYIILFFIFCSTLEKGLIIKHLKILSAKCLEIYSKSKSFIFYLKLLDWCYQNYPIKTFLFFFFCQSCVTFKYMHYFDVGFHFYEFFESLLYFFLNFFICLILVFFLFIFFLNCYGFSLQFKKLNKIYQYSLFFSLFYLLCACPFYFIFDLLGVDMVVLQYW